MENQRIRLSKTMLKNALIELLKTKNIEKITIYELCSTAQINRTTFYKYYGSQYDLLADIERELFNELETHLLTGGETEYDKLKYVLEFLDADTYEQRLNILAGLHHRITEDMLTTMAIACDVELNEGDVEEKYEALKNCLLTLEKYECNRMR